MAASDTAKTVFISYRRSVHKHLSMLLFKDLRENGFEPFRDSDTMGAGEFERIILHEIARRTHFILLLSRGTLERCVEPGDWLRREIEYALETGRNIVPVLVDGFKFNDAEPHLTGELSRLKSFQAQPLYTEEFELYEVGLKKLVSQKLQLPVYTPPPPAPLPEADARKSAEIVAEAIKAPRPTQEELSAEQWFARALGKLQTGDLDGAIADYTEAIRLNPGYVYAYNNRGNTRAKQGDMTGAIADYDKAIALNPDYAEAYSNRAEAYFALKRVEKALADFKRANELGLDHPITMGGLAITHHAMGKVDEARRLWGELLKQDARYRDVEWVQKELNWPEPLVEEVRKLIAGL
jgi:tetratricopeptide (TPR) repeat protein